MSRQDVTVDFVAKGASSDEWQMILVESGPWKESTERNLRRIQERLYGCLDAALDGELAARFPDSLGKRIVVRLDCYNLPVPEVQSFFQRFAGGALSVPGYKEALAESPFVSGISFRITFDSIH